MKFINYRVSAGRVAAKLKNDLVGLTVVAPTGYSNSGQTVYERIGTVKQFRPEGAQSEIAYLFQWADENGTAEIGILKSEEITLCLSPDQLHLIKRLEA
jgi:hypothetical protein